MPYKLSKKSVIELHKLSILKEDDKYIVGREQTEIYVLLSKLGVEIIRSLQKKKKLSEIENSIKKRYGKVDIIEFVNNLVHHGFVKKIDKKFLHVEKGKTKKLISYIEPRKVSWLFSPIMYTAYFIIAMLAITILIVNPHYFPKSQDYFFTQYYTLLFPVSFLATWAFILMHELGHYVAARSRNISARFGISHRLHYLVATTTVTNVYALTRNKRFRVILSGILVDILVICLGMTLLFLSDWFLGFPILAYKIIKFIILIEFLGILWQFLFFLKTDIYYAFEHFIGIYNLMQKTRLYLLSKIRRTFPLYLKTREKKIIKIYSAFMILGFFIIAFVFLFYSLPILISLFVNSAGNLVRGVIALNFSFFYDKLIFLFFWAVNQSLLIYAIIRRHDLRKKPWFFLTGLILFIATNYFVIFFVLLLFMVIIKSALVLYILVLLLGVGSCIIFVRILRKLNKMTRTRIIPELFLFGITITYSVVLTGFSRHFMQALAITGQSSILIGICYAVGIAIGYMYVYERDEAKKIGKKIRFTS